jgi:protein ImuB
MGARTPQSEDLVAVIDDLANRLSPDQLWRPTPQASHVPERAASIAAPLAATAPWPYPPGERPIRLLRPPEPIEAIAPVPDDPPILFRWRGALHRVRAASLPERIGAEWWRRSVIDTRFRDYYRVEDQQGARFWLFRTGLPGSEQPPEWYLHGLFG